FRHPVAVVDPDREEVEDARALGPLLDHAQRALERLAVFRRALAPGRIPAVEMRELHAQERRLQPVEPFVVAEHCMVALPELAEVAPAPRLVGDVLVVRADRAAVTESTEVLARVEAERGG